jgi:hypothetical protein
MRRWPVNTGVLTRINNILLDQDVQIGFEDFVVVGLG